jgi:hypothetical protein
MHENFLQACSDVKERRPKHGTVNLLKIAAISTAEVTAKQI